MGIRIKYPDGREEYLPTAIGVRDEESLDLEFVDWQGNTVKVIEDEEGIQWFPSNQ